MRFEFRFPNRRKSTLHVIGRKNRFGKAVGLQNAFVHQPVARTYASLSTSYIDRDSTTRLPRCRVEADGPPFDLETAVDGVKKRAQSKLNGALGRVEFDLDGTGRKRRILGCNRLMKEADQQNRQ